ncbi:MAG: AAA family ATPase [Deltaproteobacteria bacterium]|nr:AAA family ATPase [Deltaproteobacteria bacterium]
MRIKQLDLKAFGPFTDQLLKFDTESPGLHIIFGPNEAGKSSSLRALKAWLFGFPERTGDNFVHTNDNLLIGGSLMSEDGRELSFFRRKKRKADILDLNGDPITPDLLAVFVPIKDRLVFESLYGVDHEGLIQGGEDILAQKGDVGQTLFSAGTGISSLRDVIFELEKQADELFKARGSKQKINETIARYKLLQKSVKDAILSSREWKELNNDLTKTTEALKEVDQERAEKDRERRQLERIKQALPQLIQRTRLHEKIVALGSTVELPADFSEHRRSVEKQLYTALREQIGIQQKNKELDDNLKNLSLDRTVLEYASSIEKLSEGLGEYNKAMRDRPRLDGMRSSCRSDALLFLKQVNQDFTVDRIEELRPVFGKRKLIQSLAAKHSEIQQALRQIKKRDLKLKSDLESAGLQLVKLPAMADTSGLKTAIHQARRLGDIDEVIREKLKGLEESRLSCQQDLHKIGLWSGELVELLSLPLPLLETISRFEDEFQNLRTRQRDTESRITLDQARMDEVLRGIEELRQVGDVLTEDDLTQIRSKREQGWILLRKQWIDNEIVDKAAQSYDSDLDLPDAYEKIVKKADSTADRLRREADRVHQYATLKAEESTLQKKRLDMKNIEDTVHALWTKITKEWQQIWEQSKIDPLSPKEMQSWQNQIETLRFKVTENQRLEREIKAVQQDRLQAKHQLLAELHQLEKEKGFQDELLDPLLTHCEDLCDRINGSVKVRQNIEEKQAKAKFEREQLLNEQEQETSALAQWQQQWTGLVSNLSGSNDVLPEEAADLLENLQNCFAKLKEAEDFQKRINGIDADAKAFSEAVAALCANVAPNLVGQPLERTVEQLKSNLKLAVKNWTLNEKYAKEKKHSVSQARETALSITELEKQQKAQCRLAGVETAEELEIAEELSRTFREHQKALADVERLLIEGGEGLTIETLEAQAENSDPDELTHQIASLRQNIEQDLDPRIRQLSELIGQKRSEISKMDGNAKAAEALEEGEQELAHLSKLINQYVTLKLATQVLKKEIERFRAENQDPVLKIASKYFHKLTVNSFSGLRTDEDNQGNPILVGLRTDGSRIQVTQMSAGTRDQLYLALRFASLEWKLQSGEPMPFILDDILINFDDDRSLATLNAMAELSTKTQVILFTHHRRIVEAAQKLDKSTELRILEL